MLQQEKIISTDHISRYNGFSSYYNTEDEKYMGGRVAWLSDDTTYLNYVTQKNDTWENIALKYYANPTFWWVILDANKIADPFMECKPGYQIKIPVLSNITFEGNN